MYTTNKIEVHQRKSHDSIIWDIHNAFTGHTLDVINNSSNTQHEEVPQVKCGCRLQCSLESRPPLSPARKMKSGETERESSCNIKSWLLVFLLFFPVHYLEQRGFGSDLCLWINSTPARFTAE